MPSGWDVYYAVFLSAFLALGIPVFLALTSWVVSPRRRRLATAPAPPQAPAPLRATQLGKKINARFFLAANAALVLIALALLLVPCVGILQQQLDRPALARGLISLVTIAGITALGLLYSARKGDLGWLSSFHKEDP